MWLANDLTYEAVLDDFKSRFNTNPRAQKLVKDWNRLILLDATDTRTSYGLLVDNQQLKEVRHVDNIDDEEENMVHLQGEEQVLKDIFSGKYNPATALTDGALAVFSKDKDKVKLEALAMVIWRLG